VLQCVIEMMSWFVCALSMYVCVGNRGGGCSALQCDAARCSALQCIAVCCSALQCVAVRCSVLWRRCLVRARLIKVDACRKRGNGGCKPTCMFTDIYFTLV